MRHRDVVRIQPRDELTARLGEPHVQAGREAEVATVGDEPDARIGVLAHDLRASVGGPVVHHDQLEIAELLREDAVHGGAHVPLAVVHRHDDTHARRDHRLGPVQRAAVLAGSSWSQRSTALSRKIRRSDQE